MKTHAGTVFLIFLAAGCGKSPSDAQLGRYCESGSGSRMQGRVHITDVRGNKLNSTGGIVGPVEHVLFIAIALPAAQTSNRGSSEAGPSMSTWTYAFELEGGRSVSAHIQWDRVADVVVLAGKRFDRGHGNVFLVEFDSQGNQVPRQNSTVRTGLVPDGEVSRVIKEEFPHLSE